MYHSTKTSQERQRFHYFGCCRGNSQYFLTSIRITFICLTQEIRVPRKNTNIMVYCTTRTSWVSQPDGSALKYTAHRKLIALDGNKSHLPVTPPCTAFPLPATCVSRASWSTSVLPPEGWTTCTRKTWHTAAGLQWKDGIHPAIETILVSLSTRTAEVPKWEVYLNLKEGEKDPTSKKSRSSSTPLWEPQISQTDVSRKWRIVNNNKIHKPHSLSNVKRISTIYTPHQIP